MKYRTGGWLLGLACAVLGMTASFPGKASDFVPLPANDPFYVAPAGYEVRQNGAILADRKVSAEFLLPILSTDIGSAIAEKFGDKIRALKSININAYQLLYKTTDEHGRAIPGVATVLVPQARWAGPGTRPLISYQVAENSTSTRCAPSYTIRTGVLGGGVLSEGTYESLLALFPLLDGKAVIIPDHEGPDSEYNNIVLGGHVTLDGIRAALSYAPAGLTAKTKIGLIGYSNGASTTGWVAEQKQFYAPELNVVGAAIGDNPNSDLAAFFKNNDGKPVASGLLALAITGLKRGYPEAGVDAYLNPAGKQLFSITQDLCTIGGVTLTSFIGRIENYTLSPGVNMENSAPGKFLFNVNSIGKATPDMPILNFQDQFDELVPAKTANDIALKYCKAGGQVEVMRTATPVPLVLLVHTLNLVQSFSAVMNYLDNRFNGIPPRNDCPAAAVWSSPWPLPYYPFLTQ